MISLFDVIKYYIGLPHQDTAIEYLQKNVSSNVMEEFSKLYRSESLYQKAAEFIIQFEGFRAQAYLDPLKVPTIGYGTTVYSDGTKVKLGQTITRNRAKAQLMSHLYKTVETLEFTVPLWNLFNENQKIAVISFAYNLGENFYGRQGFSSISRYLSQPQLWGSIEDALVLYRNPGSVVEVGLRRRRLAEAEKFKELI